MFFENWNQDKNSLITTRSGAVVIFTVAILLSVGCGSGDSDKVSNVVEKQSAEGMRTTPPESAPEHSVAATDSGDWIVEAYPEPSGQHLVGVRDFEFTDRHYHSNRPEDNEGRRIMARVWYPAATPTRRRAYLEGVEEQALIAPLVNILAEFLPGISHYHELNRIITYSHIDAPAAEIDDLPMIVYNHGGLGFVSMNTALMEELASRGYICISVAHPGEASGVVYPNGDLAELDPMFAAEIFGVGGEKTEGTVGERFEKIRDYIDDGGLGPRLPRWRDDLIAVVDYVESGDATGDIADVFSRANSTNLVYAGLSYGGAAAASAAHVDSRARAAINLDGTHWLSDLLDQNIRVPLLVFTSEPGPYYSNEFFFEPVKTMGERSDVTRIRLLDIVHFELFESMFLPLELRQKLPGGGRVSGQRTHALLARFFVDFLDFNLHGVDNGFPAQTMAAFPKVENLDLSAVRNWANSEGQ